MDDDTCPPSRAGAMANIRGVIFVVRCAGAATAAYALAGWLGLHEAAWTAISAVVVSQEQLHETQSSLTSRLLGTAIGIVVTILVSAAAREIAAPTTAQMAISVAICAGVAHRHAQFRVAMWTCPILLNATSGWPVTTVALLRGSEIAMGALIGWLFHWTGEWFIDAIPG